MVKALSSSYHSTLLTIEASDFGMTHLYHQFPLKCRKVTPFAMYCYIGNRLSSMLKVQKGGGGYFQAPNQVTRQW